MENTSLAEQALYNIELLVKFAYEKQLIDELDLHFVRNSLLDLFRFTEPYEGQISDEELSSPTPMLEVLIDYGYTIGLIPEQTVTYRDLLDAKIMGLLMPSPSATIAAFRKTAADKGMEAAMEQFYNLSINSNYIQMDRIRKNISWPHPTSFGELQMTINLSKPEKDPKEIALLKGLPSASYPKCLLCIENVGYAGRVNHPARQNLRTIPLTLQQEEWQIQYSPYMYYNEHCIVLKTAHEPMVMSAKTMARLLEFVEQLPQYFIGSNADLPIVGGSILGHDHFQAGRHTFPIETAPRRASYQSADFAGVTLSIVQWPMSVLRLNGTDRLVVQKAASFILDAWRQYSDHTVGIFATSTNKDGSTVPHNTITPIARMLDNGLYELDLVLRNNRTSEEHPDGIFHPHQHLHHIKKENIGLIEVMGLAILPGRLKEELQLISQLLSCRDKSKAEAAILQEKQLHQHADWIRELIQTHGCSLAEEQAEQVIKHEVGEKFLAVLHDAGVYKQDENGQAAFENFVASMGFKPFQH